MVRDDSPKQVGSACRSRQDCMVALMRLQDERQNLLRLSGFTSDNVGLADLIKVFGPERALPPRSAGCAELARRCRDLNNHNGALVASRMRRIQGLLAVITGKRSEKMTYGREAQQGFGSRGRVLVTEA